MTRDAIRRRLEERLAVLRRRTGEVERDLRMQRNPDSEERAIEMENDDVLEALEDGGRAEIARIQAALARMDDGSYGTCSECGESIAPGRLEALPFASTCIECAT